MASDQSWHSLPPEAAFARFGTDPEKGLSREQVDASRRLHGPNELPKERTKSPFLVYLGEFNNPIIYILLVAAIVTSLVADISDSLVIFAVVFINTGIGFYQERKAEAALNALKNLTSPLARVVRDGAQQTLNAAELVCGDLILVESGTKIQVDIRLSESKELSVDESILTGESLPVGKDAAELLPADAFLGNRINMLYAGTIVQRGRGQGIVTAVGAGTELGLITKNIVEAERNISPLQRRLAQFGKGLSIAIGIVIIAIFLAGVLEGNSILQMFLTSVGMAVSAIPEGLPVSVTVALSIGVYAMARKHAIIRKLDAVETLGSTTVICTDKTGTLTANAMTVTRIFAEGRYYEVTGTGYNPSGAILLEGRPVGEIGKRTPLGLALRAGLLCTESKIVRANGSATLVGDPTEGALIAAALKAGFSDEEEETDFPVIDMRPFESENQYMAITVLSANFHPEGKPQKVLLIKGSIERILGMCAHQAAGEGRAPIDAPAIHEAARRFSAEALRVIACAYKPLDGEQTVHDDVVYRDCVFTGLMGMYDPPREEAKEAIEACKSAGVKVIMITGDHKDTARAIAEQLRLDDEAIDVVTGAELEAMSDKQLRGIVDVTEVFARVSPAHKLRIVRQLQERRHIVAMTGDGVNDAPALKAADIGVAMGSGTDVAKEAASMVVLDDNFASIVSAVRHGRVIYDNLQHIILFILSTSFGGVLTLLASIVAGMPLPLLPAQLLWINLVTDGISTFPLAYEREHGNVMRRKPRSTAAGLIPKEMVIRILVAGNIMMFGTLAVYQWALNAYGYYAVTQDLQIFPLAKARAMAFVTLALFQIWNVHNSRSLAQSIFRIGPFSNKPLLVVMLASLTLQTLAIHLPGLNDLLRVIPLDGQEWAVCIAVSISIILVIETSKWLAAFLPRMAAKRGAHPLHGRRT